MSGPIFIAGSGRSGTTILGRTLGLHPSILGFLDETRFLVERGSALLDWAFEPANERLAQSFRQGARGGFVGKAALRELVDCPATASPAQIFRRLRYGGFYSRPVGRTRVDVGFCRMIDHTHYEQTIDSFLSRFPQTELDERLDSVRVLCDDLFRPSMERLGATRWCDDTPRNVLYMHELGLVFPDAKMIHMIRDGRDVARSYGRLGWLSSRREAMHMWYQTVRLGRSVGAHLGPDRYREVVFEKLMENPERELRAVLEFLREDWTDEIAAHDIRNDVPRSKCRESDDDLDGLFEVIASDLREEFGWQ